MLSFRYKLNAQDPETIRKISASTGFFDATDVKISVNLANSVLSEQEKSNQSQDIGFLLAEYNGKTVSYACFGKIEESRATYELFLFSTLNEYRGQGIGRKMIQKLLETIKDLGGTKLFIKTDGTEQYAPTRRFYESCGFTLEAVLKEYYNDKDDCYIYSYKLPHSEPQNILPAE